MDKLAKQLRADAEQIEVTITPELDARMQASLRAVRQERKTSRAAAGRQRVHTASFWWASSLSGVAATVAVIAVMNLTGSQPEMAMTEPPAPQYSVPKFTWKPKAAILTESLEQELEDIRSDLKKAEQALKEDIDNVM